MLELKLQEFENIHRGLLELKKRKELNDLTEAFLIAFNHLTEDYQRVAALHFLSSLFDILAPISAIIDLGGEGDIELFTAGMAFALPDSTADNYLSKLEHCQNKAEKDRVLADMLGIRDLLLPLHKAFSYAGIQDGYARLLDYMRRILDEQHVFQSLLEEPK
jgi:hypothetical protein